jgi:hypothetical protein
LQEATFAATIALEISSRNSRVAAIQKRCDRFRAGLDPILISGGRHGRSARRHQRFAGARLQAKKADRLVAASIPVWSRWSPNCAPHERHAAAELGQRKTRVEERKVIDASPAAVTLAMLMTGEGLDSLEKRAGAGKTAGRGIMTLNPRRGEGFTEPLGSYIRQRPRIAAALAFGSVTMAVTYLAWLPDARINHAALTVAAGVAHALAGAITGRRLVDSTRTRTSLQAGSVGAATSLLAVVLFSPAFAVFLSTSDVRPFNVLSFLLLTILTGVFSFLGAGWALLLVSVGVGWGIHRIAALQAAA